MAKYVDQSGLDRFYDNIADRPVQAFETVADMQAATYLEAGMTCHTNGFHTSGDGGAAYYTVSASGDIALQGGLYASRINAGKAQSPLFCVSSYTSSFGTSNDYYLAISLDGGKSYKEIKDSRNFANAIIGTDVSCYVFGNGVLMLATAGSSVYDFYAVYTEDFETYAKTRVSTLGFGALSAELSGIEGAVWAPKLLEHDGKYYIYASIQYQEPGAGGSDVYFTGNVRYLHTYYCEVAISINQGAISFTRIGDLKQFSFDNTYAQQSNMDMSIIYKDSYFYAAYKDRVYNVVNIARSETLDGTFSDIQTCVLGRPFIEASYWVEHEGQLTLIVNDYQTNYDIALPVNSLGSAVTFGDPYEFGLVSPSFDTYRMRNPGPCVLTEQLFQKLLAAYDVDTAIEHFEGHNVTFVSGTFFAVASKVLYDAYGIYTAIPDGFIVRNSTRSGYTDLYIDLTKNNYVPIRVDSGYSVTLHCPSTFTTLATTVAASGSSAIRGLYTSGGFVKVEYTVS